MKTQINLRRSVPALSTVALLSAIVLGGWCLAPEVHSQAPNAATPNAALVPLLTRLKAQQAQLAANQTKIEAQTAVLKEDLRQAKLFSARGGGSRR